MRSNNGDLLGVNSVEVDVFGLSAGDGAEGQRGEKVRRRGAREETGGDHAAVWWRDGLLGWLPTPAVVY